MKIYIAEFASIKHPAMRKMILITNRNIYLFADTLDNNVCAAPEIPNKVQTYENNVALATINMILPVVFADSIKMSNKSFHFTSR